MSSLLDLGPFRTHEIDCPYVHPTSYIRLSVISTTVTVNANIRFPIYLVDLCMYDVSEIKTSI